MAQVPAHSKKLPFKKGDTVEVVQGKESGKRGKVLHVLASEERIVVERVNFIKRHIRPSNEYETGPDGQRYAVGGEVGIDTSAIPGDPEATLLKAQTVMRAAMAPAEPSAQDQLVAAAAKTMESQAFIELAKIESEAAASPPSDSSELGASESSERTDTSRPLDEEPAQSAGATGDVVTGDESGRLRTQLEQRIAAFFARPAAAFDLQA